MAYIRTIPPAEATGKLKEFYNEDILSSGFVENTTQAFSLPPEVYEAARNLLWVIKKNIDLRRYELITVIAASRLRCSY